MSNIPNDSSSASVKWAIEIYDQDLPTEDSSSNSIISALSVIASPQARGSIDESIRRAFGNSSENDNIIDPNAKINATYGLRGLSFGRSKTNPDNSCTLSIVGPLPVEMVQGNWVVISSFSGVNNNIVRFVGQIDDVDPDYTTTDEQGLIFQSSTVTISEWSKVLTANLMYNLASIQKASSDRGGAGVVASALNTFAENTDTEAEDGLEKLLNESFSPIESVHAVLRIMGIISENDAYQRVREDVDNSYNSLVLSPPQIPTAVMQRLGLSGQSGNDSLGSGNFFGNIGSNSPLGETPNNPWQNGFVKVASGSTPKEGFNDLKDNWNGIFNLGVADTFIQKMKEEHKNRPFIFKSTKSLMNLPFQFTAWGLISQMAEPAIYEIYTDLWYEQDPNDPRKTTSQPILVVRDKPFMLRQISNGNAEFPYTVDSIKESVQQQFSKFDDIPRIRLKDANIKSVRFKTTSRTSPNYIYVNHTNDVYGGAGQLQFAALNSIVRLGDHQRLFGGQEATPTLQYSHLLDTRIEDGDDGDTNVNSTNILQWYQVVSETMRIWYSYMYRMATASVTVIDDNTPISVGFNLSFRTMYYEMVGHIDSFRVSFNIEPDGKEITQTNIGLSRITYKPLMADNNNLQLLPRGAFGRLTDRVFANEANGSFSVNETPEGSAINIGSLV